MNIIISFLIHRSLYLLTLTLTIALIALPARSQERVVDEQSQTTQKNAVSGHRISGRVTMLPDGNPVANAMIEVISTNPRVTGRQPFIKRATTNEQGKWIMDKVPDGDYLIIVDPIVTPSIINNKDGRISEVDSAGTKFVPKRYELKISGTDIDNLAIEVVRGGRISGKVIMDGGEPLPKDLIVMPEQTTENDRSPVRFVPVQPDGTFVLEGVPTGSIRLKVVVYGKSNEYYTKTATAADINLLSETLNIVDGSEVKGVHIVFAKTAGK